MDIERTMEFLLEQQSRFAQQQDRFDARQQRHDERQAKFEDDLLQINTVLLDVANSQERGNEITLALAERQIKTEEILQTLISTLDERQQRHDERQAKFEDDLLQINSVLLDVANSQERGNGITLALAERQIKTEEILQTLISTVERHIAGHS
jgi:hypothetical protein